MKRGSFAICPTRIEHAHDEQITEMCPARQLPAVCVPCAKQKNNEKQRLRLYLHHTYGHIICCLAIDCRYILLPGYNLSYRISNSPHEARCFSTVGWGMAKIQKHKTHKTYLFIKKLWFQYSSSSE